MNGVVGEASQGEAGAGEDGFDLVGGREAANSIKDVCGLFAGQHLLIDLFFSVSPCLRGELAPPVRRANAHISEPRRTCAMSSAHHLLRLALAAVRSSPQRPLVA